MKKVKLDILALSSNNLGSDTIAMVLGETSGNRRLLIVIGFFEAQAIATEIEDYSFNRPMTHDLFKSFAQSFDIELHEIIISHIKEGTFYAKMVCSMRGSSDFVELDARPSDAIAIAVRFGVPIYAYESLLKEAGVELGDTEDEADEKSDEDIKSDLLLKSLSTLSTFLDKDEEKSTPETTPPPAQKKNPFRGKSRKELETILKAALQEENYEQAAKIRDEIEKRSNP